MITERRPLSALALLTAWLLVVGVAGCGSDEPLVAPEEMEAARPAEAPHDDHPATAGGDGTPRVYFVEPEMGATVTSPVKLVFDVENFTIEPRGDGAVHHGAGHHHIGIDTTCLPPGELIPEAPPWVHFGDGSNQIEVQLPPGEHHIVTQIGDGEHRTLDEPGLCAELHLTVVEGEAAPAEGGGATE
ncbi:MAG TPA: DUF4399 domain-containing protein [Thermoanaerobaculia bacterium]|nr:DUF4399 domain-containing protein [Thermoanaerobaculia bacterium]